MAPLNGTGRYIVAVGQITLRPGASVWKFTWLSILSLLQARWSAGAVHAATRGLGQSYYSLTLWRSEEEMRTYARSGSHHRAMMATRELAQSVRFCHWRADRAPDWDQVLSMFTHNAEHTHASAGRAQGETARAA